MKYDKEQHEAKITQNLFTLFLTLDIAESRIETITPEELIAAVEQTYPLLAGSDRNATSTITKERKRIIKACQENLYYYKLIKKRA
jgi:hypothetical protein